MAVFPGAVATDVELYLVSNNLSALLDGAIDAVVTTIPVISTTGFPTTGWITIDQEAITYTGITGTSFTGCTRGAGGTVAASHLNGANVKQTVVAAHHNALKDEIKAIETYLAAHLGLTTTITAAEFERLSGVSSNIQTQLNGKEPTITVLTIAKGGTNSGVALINNRIIQSVGGAIVEAAGITAGRALVSDSQGIPTHSPTTTTELGHVSGVTANIQTQLDGKVNDTGDAMTGDLDMSGNDVRRVASLNDTYLSGLRNRITNGEFEFDQRQEGLGIYSINGSSIRTLDCWSGEAPAADGVFSVAQNSTVPPGFIYAQRVVVTTADASVGAGQDYDVRTAIEGYNIKDLLFGTGSAKQITISFWVRSSQTGTFGLGIINQAFNRSYVAQYTINVADTFEFKTITLTGDTTGTWLNQTGVGLRLLFDMGSGTTVEGTANAWQAGNFFRASGNTRLINTNAATWYMTGLQLEVGATATAYESLSPEVGFIRVQRYLQKSYLRTAAIATTNSQGSERFRATAAGHQHMVPFKVNMRAAPTVTFYNYSTGATGSWYDNTAGANRTVSNALASDRALCGEITGGVSGNEMLGHWLASAEL